MCFCRKTKVSTTSKDLSQLQSRDAAAGVFLQPKTKRLFITLGIVIFRCAS